MNVLIVGPAMARRGRGNHVTARRWGRILTELGHEVAYGEEYDGSDRDLLIALHAIHSAGSVQSYRTIHPHRPLIVGLTGTDIYGSGGMLAESGRATARESMAAANALVAFHPLAIEEVPEGLRAKVRVIAQSVRPPARLPARREGVFEVSVVGELRDVKDPFRAALAARQQPRESRIRVLHAGAASSPAMAERALEEERLNGRYNWLGEMSHRDTLGLIARSRLLAITSRHEGGPNALTEALALSTPVVASRIPGTVGILGDDYAGYFAVEDTEALADLLRRAETDAGFYESLLAACTALSELASPAREVDAWRDLLSSF